jgi:hypothetical protein
MAIPAPVSGDHTYFPGAALTVTPDSVYFAAGIAIGTMENSIARVSLRNGTPDPSQLALIPTDGRFTSGPIVNDGTDLYFVGGTSAPQSVVALGLDGGTPRTLPDPVMPFPYLVNDLAATSGRGVLWLAWNGKSSGTSSLALWDGTATSAVASFPEPPAVLVVGGVEAFVQTASALYSVPLAGGTPTELRPVESNAYAQILGFSDGALFFSPDGSTLVRRDLSSGVESVLVTGAALQPVVGEGHSGWVDSKWVYYPTGPSGMPSALSRVRVVGGTPEVVWDDPDHPPSGAVATDACNVYWLTGSAPRGMYGGGGPSILMTRAE